MIIEPILTILRPAVYVYVMTGGTVAGGPSGLTSARLFFNTNKTIKPNGISQRNAHPRLMPF